MNTSTQKSILFQLIIVIAGASIISAIVSSVGHYMFTSSIITKSANEQASSALEVSKHLLTDEYTRYINHDLNLIQASPLIQLSNKDGNQQQNSLSQAKEMLGHFILNSDSAYEAIIILNGDEEVIMSANAKNNTFDHLNTKGTISEKEGTRSISFGISELQNKINENRGNNTIFYGPQKDDRGYLFFAGIKIKTTNPASQDSTAIIIFNIDKLIEHMSHIKILGHSAVWLFTYNGNQLYQPSNNNSSNPFEYIFKNKEKPKNLIIRYSERGDTNSIAHLIKTVVSVPPENVQTLLRQSILIMGIIVFSITLIVVFIALWMAKRIVLPIQHLTTLSQKVAAGDFNVRMPTKRKDELGILSQAFNIMIQELEEQRYELKSLANKDTLTQLPNRRQFEEHLAIVLNSCNRNNQAIAIMYIDLDNFKDTNDSFGHPAGDKLIRDVSTRLVKTVRQSDLVARLGGDEFAIILNPHKTKTDTEYVAKKILGELNKPFTIENQQIFSGGSIGISIFPEHGENLTELVKNADAAMYKAKSMGRNSYQFYSGNLTAKANERVVLGALIRNAIVNDLFTLFYQPKIDLITKKVIGAEALLRWEHKGKTILPSKIINVAESSGIIERVDAWVLNKACSQIKKWEMSGDKIIPISINISGRLLGRNKITGMLKQVLHQYSLDPKWIEIEITENDLISDHENTQKILKVIHSLGVRIAIDDFGTGYSSLSYLKDLAADTLKIDRKFVVNAMANHADKEIASAIVKLAKALHMHVVVEGIETEEQEKLFRDLGAQSAQGYLYAKAMPMDKFIRFIESNDRKQHMRTEAESAPINRLT